MPRTPGASLLWPPSPSACGALLCLAGLAATQALPLARPPLAVLVGGLALAAPPAARRLVLPLAAGLVLGWRQPVATAAATLGFDPARPVTVVAHQVEDWSARDGLWHCRVRVELVRQGTEAVRWPHTLGWSWSGAAPPEGSRWRVVGWLRRVSSPAHGAAARPPRWFLRVKSERLVEALPDRGWLRGAAGRARGLRREMRQAVAGAAPGSAAERLVRALVLGEASALPDRQLRALRRSGLAHVVALSGFHLGLVAAWCALLGRPLPRAARVLLVVLGTAGYVVVGGGRASLLRAWLMINASAAALIGGRPARSLHALTWSAAVLAAWRPESLGDTGFRLTFAATAGVVLGMRAATRAGAGQLPLVSGLAATLGAQVATLPITATAFHWLPPWAWAWNLLLVPVVALAVPLCLLWAIAAMARPSVAAALSPALGLLAAGLALPAGLPPGLLGGLPWVPGPALLGAVGVVAVVVAFGPARWRLWAAVLGAAALAATVVRVPGARHGDAVVRFVDVGQGDATLLGDGPAAMLIDGGGWRGPGVAERALLPVLGRAGVRRLDVVVVSHGDRDHCGGVVELADYLRLDEVWVAPGAALSPCGLELSRRPGLRLRPLWAGMRLEWRDWEFQVLAPPAGARGSANDDSLVLRGESRGRSVLFTGDTGHLSEFRLLGRVPAQALEVSLLKVAHHGSAASTSRSLLAAARPRLAVVSAGTDNPFGHPASRVLERLRAAGVAVLRTDRDGLVEIRWRARRVWRLTTPAAPADGLQ